MRSQGFAPTCLAFILCSLHLHGQASAPRLTISTAHNQKTFHIGERIALELSFTGPDDNTYSIDLASYDRSGRLTIDSFSAEPKSGWADPLAAYFAFGTFMGGGLRGGKALSSHPIVVNVDLNEWLRFDQPGTYRITVISHRTGPTRKDDRLRPGQKQDYFFPTNTIALASDAIELTIIPATPEWQASAFARTQKALAKPIPADAEPSPEYTAAAHDLRYLASPSAAATLAANLRDGGQLQPDTFFGLIGLPLAAREPALAAMRHLMDDPSFPVCQGFVEAMGWLKLDQTQLPSGELTAETAQIAVSKIRASRDSVWELLSVALAGKEGAARAATAQTLVELQPVHPSPSALAELGSALRAAFPTLSASEQTRLLAEHWPAIRSRELLPAIRKLAITPETPEAPWIRPQATALRRWFELEPEGAAPETRRQLNKENPTLTAMDVSFLPDKSLPQFEALWAKGFEEGNNINDYEPAASLLLRFGTGAVSIRMAALVGKQGSDFACNRSDEALAYLVRFDPEAARPFLIPPPNLPPTRQECSSHPLAFIARQMLAASPLLTEAALATLARPDEVPVDDPVRYLSEFGDSSTRQPLLDLYLNWSERPHPIPAVTHEKGREERQSEDPDSDRGGALAATLLNNQGWVADPTLNALVLQHCTLKAVCEEVQGLQQANLTVSAYADTLEPGGEYVIGHFTSRTMDLFADKLDQFPKGTTFTLTHCTTGFQTTQDELEASLPGLFASHGMKLIVPNHE